MTDLFIALWFTIVLVLFFWLEWFYFAGENKNDDNET